MQQHGTYPHQNAPVEQFLKLGQTDQAQAFCVLRRLFFGFCAVAPTQLQGKNGSTVQLCCSDMAPMDQIMQDTCDTAVESSCQGYAVRESVLHSVFVLPKPVQSIAYCF